jgi:hypothetical protein
MSEGELADKLHQSSKDEGLAWAWTVRESSLPSPFLSSLDRVSPCSSDCPGTCNLPTSASWVLGHRCVPATMPGFVEPESYPGE